MSSFEEKTNNEKGGDEMLLEKKAMSNLAVFQEVLAGSDFEKLRGMFSSEASLILDDSPNFFRNPNGAKNSLESILGSKFNLIEQAAQVVPTDSLIHSGRYNFEIGPKEKRTDAKAGFSFLWDPKGIIHHHHSSLNPNGDFVGSLEDVGKNRNLAQAREFFEKWNEALQTRDSKIVAKLYHIMASFFPTLNAELKRGIEGAEKYFGHFLKNLPFGTIVTDAVKTVPSGSIVHSVMINGEGEDKRMTILWPPDGKIYHLHESIRPPQEKKE